MMTKLKFNIWFSIALALPGCNNEEPSDAYGNFEATTVTVSAKGNGELRQFPIEESMQLSAGQQTGYIDTTQLHLEKLQVQAQIISLGDKIKEAEPEIALLLERKENLLREYNRTKNLVVAKAATPRQLDEYEGEIKVVNQQITTTQRQTSVINRGILAERGPLLAKVDVLKNNIADHVIINPIAGTVLTKYVEPGELVTRGRPLYKIANLKKLKLKAYANAKDLQKVAVADSVTVLIDEGDKAYKELPGVITWISNEAEFTPENIQTRKERTTLVYALDVMVANEDGTLKIGMPGEIRFNPLNK
ncbi:HlyD family efflux transporter periplasmic adaptor subunit [Fulvivirga sp. 29W222]|uniref:HlyD family efflux transporter periplasmic adaptor subunit n=1 Tax=Fulvivirga marina TaxID=2494733 RepID=A0A937G4G9_9BACT|nr:HlyD family efflux transporter periplasmic adaptor subunit [Fulvivirga marina]MBL6448271.1 HlyD family efflux transporter periplasmic adaptor subunit [Fulvivirga marina]